MLRVLVEVGSHMANNVIIGSFIKKMCKRLFSKKLIMRITLREGQSRTESYIDIQKINV